MFDILGIFCALALAGIAIQRNIAADRAERRSRALESRGASVERWYRKVQLPNSDPWYYRIRTSHGDLLITEESYKVSRQRAQALLK